MLSFASRRALLSTVVALVAVAALLPVARPYATAEAAGALTHTVGHDGTTLTLQLDEIDIAAPGYEVLVQQDDGTLAPAAVPVPTAYLGSVDGDSAAWAAAVRRSDGALHGVVVFDRGPMWIFVDGAVVETDGIGEIPDYTWPASDVASRNVTVDPGHAGSTTYRFDVAFDLDATWFHESSVGASVERAVDLVAFDIVAMLGSYETNALVRPALARVVIRASESATPYDESGSGLLRQTRDEWRANHTDADRDLVALLHRRSGGGSAWLTGVGSTWGYSQNGGSGHKYFMLRHEIAHNWGTSDHHTRAPEGATITSGNNYARFDGTEVAAMLALRDRRVAEGVLDAEQTFAVPVPPYAALDLVDDVTSGVKIRVAPTANDFDANGDALTLVSAPSRTHLGGRVWKSGETLVYTPPAVAETESLDWVEYVVADATGKTATGVVMFRVDPYAELPPVAEWAPVEITPGVPYEIQNVHTGLDVGAADAYPTPRRALQRSGDADAARYRFEDAGDRAVRVRNVDNDACLTVWRSGRSVAHATCRDLDLRHWELREHPLGGVALVSAATGRCVEIKNRSLDDGAYLEQRPCSHDAGQRWSLAIDLPPAEEWTPVTLPTDTFELRTAEGTPLAVASTSDRAAPLVLGAATAGDPSAAHFTVLAVDGTDAVQLRNAANTSCVDVWSGSTSDGAQVGTWYCGSQANQQWRAVENPAGAVSFVSVRSGLCLAPSAADDGAIAVQTACSIDPDVRWTIA